MGVQLVALDWGHTIMDERAGVGTPMGEWPIRLMPHVQDTLPLIPLPMALWANAPAREGDVRDWLTRAGVSRYFSHVVTSEDAGARKPSAAFFAFALARCGVRASDVLFVGNQLNTDVAGGNAMGIPTVWLSGAAYRSDDDEPVPVVPTFTIASLRELPSLISRLSGGG